MGARITNEEYVTLDGCTHVAIRGCKDVQILETDCRVAFSDVEIERGNVIKSRRTIPDPPGVVAKVDEEGRWRWGP